MTESRPWEFLLRWVFPVSLIGAVLATLIFSNVPPNLAIVDGDPARAVLGVYALILIASMALPRTPLLHQIGAPLGVLAFVGRAGGFLELVLGGRIDLTAAVLERVAIAVSVTLWHMFMAYHATIAAATREE